MLFLPREIHPDTFCLASNIKFGFQKKSDHIKKILPDGIRDISPNLIAYGCRAPLSRLCDLNKSLDYLDWLQREYLATLNVNRIWINKKKWVCVVTTVTRLSTGTENDYKYIKNIGEQFPNKCIQQLEILCNAPSHVKVVCDTRGWIQSNLSCSCNRLFQWLYCAITGSICVENNLQCLQSIHTPLTCPHFVVRAWI